MHEKLNTTIKKIKITFSNIAIWPIVKRKQPIYTKNFENEDCNKKIQRNDIGSSHDKSNNT